MLNDPTHFTGRTILEYDTDEAADLGDDELRDSMRLLVAICTGSALIVITIVCGAIYLGGWS